jgi:hypothetical protein
MTPPLAWADASGPFRLRDPAPLRKKAHEGRRLLPQLRGIVGQGRRVTVCFDRGGWSPALFADITAAGFDLLTWRKGPGPGPARRDVHHRHLHR